MSLSLLWELSSIKKSWVVCMCTEQLTAAADNIGVKPTCVKWSHLGLELPQSAGGCWALTSQWGSRASQGQSKHWQLKHSHTLTLGARNNQPVTSLSLRQIKIIKIFDPPLTAQSRPSPASGEVESLQLQCCSAALLQERLWISNFTLCWDQILYILHSLFYYHHYTTLQTLHHNSEINI